MDNLEYSIACDRANLALNHLPDRVFKMPVEKMFLLAIALRKWVHVPNSLDQADLIKLHLDRVGQIILDDLLRQDPRLGCVWDIANEPENLSSYGGGRAIIERACEIPPQKYLPSATRDYMLEVVARAFTGFFKDVLEDDMEMESPWGSFQCYMVSSITMMLAEPAPADIDSDHPLWHILSHAERQVIADLATEIPA